MVTRRQFLLSTSALGAFTVVGGGTTLLAGCHSGVHVVPDSIDNSGLVNVSAALTGWLAAAAPGEVFKLRRRPDGSPGRYWVPQGVRIGKSVTFDLNGCELLTGLTLGADDPYFEANRTAFAALWDDWGEQSEADFEYINPETGVGNGRTWPKNRVSVLVAASDVTILSSRPGARIQGAARRVLYRAPGVLDRLASTGCRFDGTLEGQHAIRIGGRPGSYSDTNAYRNVRIDLTNISLEFTHGDGIYLGDNHSNITILGQNLGQSVLGGNVVDTSFIVGHDGQGADIVEGGTLDDDRWDPWDVPLPGIHHTARQGIATDFRNYDTLIEGVAIWRTGQACIDWEPAAAFSEIINPTVRGVETGIHYMLWMPCAGGAGPIHGLVVEDTVNYEKATMSTGTNTQRHANWRIENNRCMGGVKGKRDATIFDLQRIDGLQFLSNEIPMVVAGQGLDVTASTAARIAPVEVVQFPSP